MRAAEHADPPPDRPVAGITANAASMAASSGGDALAKLVLAVLPAPQTLMLRCLFLLVLLPPLFALTARRGLPVLATRRAWLHLMRFCLQFASILAALTALRNLPLTTVTTIMFVAPIFIVFSAVAILGERVRMHQLISVALGFIGCLIVIRPRGDGEMLFMLIALFSAATWAISMTLLRLLTRTESHVVILAWSNGLLMLGAAALAVFDWRPLQAEIVWLLIGMAVLQVAGQWFSMTAVRIAPASTVAPAQYTQIIWSTIIGAAVFSEWPAPSVLFGAIFIVAGGWWLMRGERMA
ncbi:MAG: hypothetical protein BGP06_01680 [Rhizobiales bacterium 65-9]|nr:MAG: hypothetical protein BGP06_01680 [Rhizobiales bacterium 65-9]